jgi:transposase
MPKTSERAPLNLSEEQIESLTTLSQSRKAPLREIERARILLMYNKGESITSISKTLKVSRPTVYKCIDKALAMGTDAGLKDKYHRPKPPQITEEAKLWVINLACTKPTKHGYAAEIWSLSHLAKHVRKHGPSAGHMCLQKAAKATIHRILKFHPLQPHKMRYYLEKRDLEFEQKMKAVLMVYREVHLFHGNSEEDSQLLVTVSVDEKPGVQAIRNIAPDLLPQPGGKYPDMRRDYEYKRLGTLSILASLDLKTGHVIGQVHKRHRSQEFIELLKELDEYYPKECTIRMILDNHSSHISKETMKYLASRPNRFVYIHTPKHGSWLNLVETLFGKMARTFLKRIRVNSIEELKERILKGIEEINAEPIVHQWKKFDLIEDI